MKIKMLTDLTMDLFVKKIKNIDKSIVFDHEYSEEIVTLILKQDIETLKDYDFLFIYYDYNFNKRRIENINMLLESIIDLANYIKTKIIISNSIKFNYPVGPFQSELGIDIQYFFTNTKLINEIQKQTNLITFDIINILIKIGAINAYNYNLGHLYQMPYTKIMINSMVIKFYEIIKLYTSEEKKVIVVDCDNTLWGGILGEDGLENIKCDLNAEGIIYYNFQNFLLEKKKEGFLICICSKNNEIDVKNALEQRNMPLKWNDFIVKKINWEDKYKNIKEISQDLNLNTNSFIFIDDSEFEICSIKSLIPEITTFLFMNDYQKFIELTENSTFRRKVITNEDLVKNEQYKQEELRKNELKKSESFEEYIKKLDIKLDIIKNDTKNFERLSQLTEKTNQFNFNKKHYTVKDLNDFIENKSGEVYSLKVKDKYGDYGIVGLILVILKNNNAVIENFLMSCRVLGRKIENIFYDNIVSDLKKRGIDNIELKFTKTNKNKPAEEFKNSIL